MTLGGIERLARLYVKELRVKHMASYFESLPYRLDLPLCHLVILPKLLHSASLIFYPVNPNSPIDFIMLMTVK